MIYVQHLLGVGHLQRALSLSGALANIGFRVELVSGGMPQKFVLADGVKLTQLSPVRSVDGSFTRLVDETGNEIDSAWQSRRRQQLLDRFESFSPNLLITETFPFGRRMMRFELLPLLEAAKASPDCKLVISSIRDILQPKSKPGRNREICDLIKTYYDHVLVHGDQRIARLDDSFALAAEIQEKLAYSGYISQAAAASGADDTDGVLVSAGGSATGMEVLRTAIAAKPLSCLADLHWRILVSPGIDAAHFAELQARADENTTVERNREDFATLLNTARLSISQAGYNTITDILQTQVAAVVIPYAEADEVEQSQRAALLQQHGRVAMLGEAELTPAALAQAIEKALQLGTSFEVALNGADRSAELIAGWLAQADASQ